MWCIPITMCLPSIIRQGMEILAFLLFFLGLVIYKDKTRILYYLFIVGFFIFYAYGVWQSKKGLASIAISILSGWEFCFFGLILRNDDDAKRKNTLFNYILFIMVITSITTLIGIQRYPLVVRELGRSVSYGGLSGSDFASLKREYQIQNISGWNHLYGITFFVPCLSYYFSLTKKKFLLICLAICELCIIRSQITFALLLSVFIIIFSVIKPSRSRSKLFGLTIFLVISIIAALNFDVILLFAVNITNDIGFTMLTRKLRDLYLLMQGITGGDALARFSLYTQSIVIFNDSPLFGAFLSNDLRSMTFSFHSDFFDMLGFYGLFGLVIEIYMIIRYLIYVIKTYVEDKWFSVVQFVAFVSLIIFNPIWHTPQVFIGVFMLPGMISSITKMNEEKSVIANFAINQSGEE